MKKILLLSVISYIAAVFINYTYKTYYPPELREEIRVVPKKEVIKLLSFDHYGFASDILFIKVNLHSGSLMWKPLKFIFDSDWSYGTMNLITDLDPKYFTAYLFSAMGLIHNFDDVKRAKPIIDKGMGVFPDSWELPFWIGYDYYVYFSDYKTASKYLWEASQKPNAPSSFLSLMLNALKEKGDYKKALWALKSLHDETKDKNIKLIYAKKIIQLENLVLLQEAVKIFNEHKNRMPHKLNELVTVKLLKYMPEDPLGMEYILEHETGRVIINKEKKIN